MTDIFISPRSGLRLNVDQSGSAGQPVLFLHGLCGDARQTAEAFPDDPAFRRITPEACGHGRSEAGDIRQFSIANFTQDVADFLQSLRTGPMVAGGISMGAAIALRLAVTRPDLVRGLMLVRPAWSTAAAPANMQPNAEVGRLLAAHGPARARALFEQGDTARRLAQEAPDNLASLLGFFDREPPPVTAALLQSISADGPGVGEDQVRHIAMPALVIGHGMDAVHPLSMAHELARLIPGARFAEITPKAADRARYVADLRAALLQFLKGPRP